MSCRFYRIRAAISQRLIEKEGFDFVAVEGDWPVLSLSHSAQRISNNNAAALHSLSRPFDSLLLHAACAAQDCYRVNRYIHSKPPPLQATHKPDESAEEALGDFLRFPSWMWRNEAVRDYAEWCRQYNERLAATQTAPQRLSVGFFGMDLYSLLKSTDAVIAFLDTVDKQAAQRARDRYATLVTHSAAISS